MSLGDFGNHFGQFLLLKLEATDGTSELLSFQRIAKGRVVAIHGSTNGAPGDSVTGRVEAAQWAFQSFDVGQEIFFRHLHIVEYQFARCRGAERPFVMRFGCGKAFHAAFHNDPADFSGFIFCPNHGDVCKRCIGNPHFGAIEQVMIAHVADVGNHASRVGAGIRFGESEAAHHVARCQFWQVLAALFFGAELVNRIHHQGALHRCRGTNPAVAALNFLHDQSVGDLVESLTAIFNRNVGTEGADFGEAFNEVFREFRTLSVRFDDRCNFFFHPGANRIADKLLLIGQQFIHQIIIVTLKPVFAHKVFEFGRLK